MLIEISYPLPREAEAFLENYLHEEGLLCWTLSEENDQTPLFIKGYFDSLQEAKKAWAQLSTTFPEWLSNDVTLNRLQEKDWKNAYKKYLTPWNYKKLHWLPYWLEPNYPINSGEIKVLLDAQMAFGTGMHPTTQLCAIRIVELLETMTPQAISRLHCLDIGCGSGILAISAKLLGIRNVFAFDIDADSIKVCSENLERNHLSSQAISFAVGGINNFLPERKGDILVANILAPVLCENASTLLSALNKEGTLILSGILQKELESVWHSFAQVIKKLGITAKIESTVLQEWADLKIKKIATK